MGTTPIYALPYVDPGSLVSAFPAADKAQAEKVEAALSTITISDDTPDQSLGSSSYPMGVVVHYISAANGATWPTAGSGVLLTVNLRAKSASFQLLAKVGATQAYQQMWYRNLQTSAVGPWVPIATDSGWTNFASAVTGTNRYRVINGIAYVEVDGGATTVSGTVFNVSTTPLPASARPVTAPARANGYFGGFPGTITVDTAGNVTAIQNSGANRASLSGIVIYPVS